MNHSRNARKPKPQSQPSLCFPSRGSKPRAVGTDHYSPSPLKSSAPHQLSSPPPSPSVILIPALGSSSVLIPVQVLMHWPGHILGQPQQVTKALNSVPSVGSQQGTPTVKGTLAQFPLPVLYLLNEPPRKTTRLSCDPQPWTLHADRLTTTNGEQKCQTQVSWTPPVSPRRGRRETPQGKRPMETFEVGEMCALLSQAVGLWAALGSVDEYRRVWI